MEDGKEGSRMGENPLKKEADSYVAGVLDVPAVQPRRRKRRWKPRPKEPNNPTDRKRHGYYVGDWVHSRLQEIAEEKSVGISDLAHYLLKDGIERIERGELVIEPAIELVRRRLS